jgi:hypothetical protein
MSVIPREIVFSFVALFVYSSERYVTGFACGSLEAEKASSCSKPFTALMQ